MDDRSSGRTCWISAMNDNPAMFFVNRPIPQIGCEKIFETPQSKPRPTRAAHGVSGLGVYNQKQADTAKEKNACYGLHQCRAFSNSFSDWQCKIWVASDSSAVGSVMDLTAFSILFGIL